MTPTTVALALSTGFALLALAVSTFALVTARRLTRWHQWPFDAIAKLESCFDEHDVELRQHHERLRRVNARLAARDRRSASKDDDDDDDTKHLELGAFSRRPGESELEWKRRCRMAIGTGVLKHGR